MTDVTHLPTPGVVLDLDLAQRDETEVKPPFIVKVGDRQVTFKDPEEISWEEFAAVQMPQDLIHVSLEREDRDHIFKQNLPTWKFNKLMEAYYVHYDLETKIAAARRQAQFSGLTR